MTDLIERARRAAATETTERAALLEALVARVERLTAERDAVIGAYILRRRSKDMRTMRDIDEHVALLPVKRDSAVSATWATCDSHEMAAGYVRRAAGLDTEGK